MVQLYLTTEVTESMVKECFEVGIRASFQLSQLGEGGGNIKPVNKCDTLTDKPTGVYVCILSF